MALVREKVKGRTPWRTPPREGIFFRENFSNTREFERIFPVKASREFPLCPRDGCVLRCEGNARRVLFARLAATVAGSVGYFTEQRLARAVKRRD